MTDTWIYKLIQSGSGYEVRLACMDGIGVRQLTPILTFDQCMQFISVAGAIRIG
jgi:hypothetical protein